MIAVLPQKGQRHRSANGPADEGQSQWVSGCFIEWLLQRFCHHFSEAAFGSMSLNNDHPVNNEGQGSGSGSGDWTKDKGRYK